MVSYIISAYNNPTQLVTCITSLLVQEGPRKIIVCDNSTNQVTRDATKKWSTMWDDCVTYIDTHAECPPDINAGYKAQNIGAELAKGDWLCFPSHDSYYVPRFQEIMLETAKDFKSNFVYCDFLYDPRYNQIISKGIYQVVPAYPRPRFCDKNNFIIKRKHFHGFDINNPNGYGDMFIHMQAKENLKVAKAPGVLVVHN